MYLNPTHDLTITQERRLLAALLSGLKPDGVRLILRANIQQWICKYEKAGAAFLIHYPGEKIPAKTMRVMCVNHGNLDRMDLERLDMLEELYNTIDQWGVKYERQSKMEIS